MHLTPEAAAKRGGYGEERYETLAMQTKVRESFAKIEKEMEGSRWITIDAGRGIDEVAADCSKAAMNALKAVRESNEKVGLLFRK